MASQTPGITGPSFCLTIKGMAPGGGPRLLRTLGSIVRVCAAFDPHSAPEPTMQEFQGIWDTGASGSVITQKVVDACGMKPTGMKLVNTANGQDLQETYLVAMKLPNEVGFLDLTVTKAKLGDDLQVLIGMDIIGQGDFAVTNRNGQTVCSFRYPSATCIDFVEEARSTQAAAALTANRTPFRATAARRVAGSAESAIRALLSTTS